MSEEATNASIAVPMAIIFSTFAATVLGWGEFSCRYTTTVPWQLTNLRREAMNISLVFCMGRDYQTIINSPIGQPMATVRNFRPSSCNAAHVTNPSADRYFSIPSEGPEL